MQTRTVGCRPGVHDPNWRENENAGRGFRRGPTTGTSLVFFQRKAGARLTARATCLLRELPDGEEPACERPDFSWRPESSVRTCIVSLRVSDRFGELMSAEAESRGFYSAMRRAFHLAQTSITLSSCADMLHDRESHVRTLSNRSRPGAIAYAALEGS
jgi:hypothetical protein